MSGQEILSDKIKRLALQFLIKQYANHSFSPLMINNELQLLDKDENTLKNSLQNYNFSPEHLLTLPIVLRHDPSLCEIFLQKFRFQNKENPVSLIVDDFSDFINRFFSDHYIIATDASKSHNSTSIAGISCNQSFSYRINPINSVFTAEVSAICVAIEELAIVDKDILILSDSFSALKNLNIHSTYVIQRLVSKLFVRHTFNQNITFLWVPGHSEILWNEKADSLAKNTTELSQFIEWLSPEDIIANLKKQSYLISETNYFRSKYYDLIGNFPDIGTITKWTQNRRQDILIARIISRMIVTLALLNTFNLDSNPFCNICNETNDLLHILLRCRKYSTSRLHLWQNLNIDENNITFKAFLSKILDCK
ncbi:RNA-directed DNA polymerase from mobile element jockey [Caerostris darwini]|uniref:RNA-directed DNA polymerase from mobile element jockey n=1 Tax=Caerostris darwini TaxID=1538125 RepID=A0AAV4U469_9ARAC|nr:RNA-directed DNA polymerase from mobile element jockey [Caerostris darwini]